MVETKLLSGLSPALQAALISVSVTIITFVISSFTKFAIDKRSLRHKLKTEYEYEQRKKLRELIGRYRGRMVEATESLNHRMWNLYSNKEKKWLVVGGDHWTGAGYYFKSMVHRFITVYCLVRRFEKDAVYIDQSVAESSDLDFKKYLKALSWAATDVALFASIPYDTNFPTDHFFHDRLRQMCDACWTEEDIASPEDLDCLANDTGKILDGLLRFLDGLSPNENRLRWDRLVVIHLILIGFLNTFGYDMQKSTLEQIRTVVRNVEHPEILQNFHAWITKLGLAKQAEARLIMEAIRSRLASEGERVNGSVAEVA